MLIKDKFLGGTEISNENRKENTSIKTVHQHVHEKAKNFPGKIALKFLNETCTYHELDQRSNQLASYLLNNGVRKGDLIGLSLDRSIEMVITMLGILKAGAAYIPLDPGYPKERLEYMLENSRAKFLITSLRYKGHLNVRLINLYIEKALQESENFENSSPEVFLSPNSLAYVLYTSGSTGKPKGVQISHGNLSNFLLSMIKEPGIGLNDKLLAVTTISFDIAGLELFLPLIAGAEIVLTDTHAAKDGASLLGLLEKENITIMQATPSTWRLMLESGWDKKLPLKVLCGGEGLPIQLAEALLERCDSLWNMYGPTETTIWSTLKKISADDEVITVGKPIARTLVYILDEQQNPVDDGTVGEIYIAGDGVSKGYLHNQQLTDERFVDDIFAGEGKMYRTGDLGKIMPDGEIQCLGRIDSQVKIRGYRIELGEIETVVQKLPNVKEAVVIVREDRPGDKRLVAYIVPAKQLSFTKNSQTQFIQQWKAQVKEILPAYMIPMFVMLPKFPLTPNGKTDRKALPKPEVNLSEDNDTATTAEETMLVSLWEELLGLERVGVHQDFFELGGHSLIAVKMITRILKITGKKIPLSALFEFPTISQLAPLIAGKTEKTISNWKSLVPIKPYGSKIPFYVIHGGDSYVMKFKNLAINMDPEQPVYAFQAIGLNSDDEPLTRMEEIAAVYVSELMRHNPDGPYAIAGYSFGGIIAFEMAKQLKALNKEIKMLAMLDTFADQSDYFKPKFVKWFNSFKYNLRNVPFKMLMFCIDPQLIVKYKMAGLRKNWRIVLNKLKDENEEQDHISIMMKKIDEAHDQAVKHYILKPYDGSVLVFRSRKKVYYMSDFKYYGWKSFALKGVEGYDIPGDHYDLLDPQHSQELARTLQQVLDNR